MYETILNKNGIMTLQEIYEKYKDREAELMDVRSCDYAIKDLWKAIKEAVEKPVYRCGWCGQLTDKYGNPIGHEKIMHTDGICCRDEQEDEE